MKKEKESLTLFDTVGGKHELKDEYIIHLMRKAYLIPNVKDRKRELRKLSVTLENIFYAKFSL